MEGNKWGRLKKEERNLNIHIWGINFVNVFYPFSRFASEKSLRGSDLNTHSTAGIWEGSKGFGGGGGGGRHIELKEVGPQGWVLWGMLSLAAFCLLRCEQVFLHLLLPSG